MRFGLGYETGGIAFVAGSNFAAMANEKIEAADRLEKALETYESEDLKHTDPRYSDVAKELYEAVHAGLSFVAGPEPEDVTDELVKRGFVDVAESHRPTLLAAVRTLIEELRS